MPTHAFTISKLAEAAGIGVEAVRYYQRRGLLQEPRRAGGGFREYARADIQRLQFIKRAQALGFSLEDVAELASLSGERNRRRVREVTQRRLAEIRERVTQLNAMASALGVLVRCCERTAPGDGCPIIAALAGTPETATEVLGSHGQSTPARSRNSRIGAVHLAKAVMA
jgi:MerR family transcriptional regulator, mercuric resistance operon regulatory protein